LDYDPCTVPGAPDFWFWVVLFGVAIVTSIISGILGMAGGMLLLVVLLVRLEPVVAIPIHGVVQLVSNGSRAWFLRRSVRWSVVARFAWPLLPAGALGIWVARTIPPAVGQIGIGVFVLLAFWAPSVIAVLARPARAERALPFGGALVGFFSIVVGATGPLLGPFILTLGLGPEGSVATMAACQIFQHGSKVLLFGVTGFSVASYVVPTLALCLAAVIGTAIGTRLLGDVPERTFQRVVRWVLTLLSLQLIGEGLLRTFGY
jgi:uncharacterized membrane protein YfcA